MIFTNYLNGWMKNTSTITILVTGKGGSGKSTLINSILGLVGRAQAAERHKVLPKATKLKFYQNMIGNVQVKVWDSPDLLAPDGTKSKEWNIEDIKRNCKDVDLCLFCVNMTDLRFIEPEHSEAVKLLSKTLGSEIWKNTVFVLTFANQYLIQIESDHKGNPEGKKRDFVDQIRSWKDKLHSAIKKEGIDARNLKLVPVGDNRSHQLLPSDNAKWLNELWREVISVAIPAAAPAALKIYDHLSRDEQSQQPASQSDSLHRQSITLNLQIGENFEIRQYQATGAMGITPRPPDQSDGYYSDHTPVSVKIDTLSIRD